MVARRSTLTFLSLMLAAGLAFGQEVHQNTHSIMHFSPEWMKEHHRRRASLPVTQASPEEYFAILQRKPGDTMGVDLSTHINFTACGGKKGWDQGQCGNCWVFGSTAASSIGDGVASGTPQLFSTQWFDSDYYATTGQSTCQGGDDTTFASWYNSHAKFIPWSNTNAGYADGSGPSTPAMPATSIAQSPNVGVSKLTVTQIATSGVSQAQAIANIKSVLDKNQPVTLSFFLSSQGWTDFDRFWDSDNETTPWASVDTYSGQSQNGGHLVCVIGYDDTNNSWLIQNSWGTTSGRPNGTFELSQTMGYGDTVGSYDMWDATSSNATLTVTTSTTGPTITAQPANQTVAVGATATFKVAATGTAPLTYQWYQGNTAISGATSSSYTTPAATAAQSGTTFHVVVRNASGSATSNNATLTVSSSVGTDLIVNGGFESGTTSWTASSGVIGQFGALAPPYAGTWVAWLCGNGVPMGRLSQRVTIPSTATRATLAFDLHITGGNDQGTFKAQILTSSGTMTTLGTYTQANAATGYQAHSFDLSAYKGQAVVILFTGAKRHSRKRRGGTSFTLDNVSLKTQ